MKTKKYEKKKKKYADAWDGIKKKNKSNKG